MVCNFTFRRFCTAVLGFLTCFLVWV